MILFFSSLLSFPSFCMNIANGYATITNDETKKIYIMMAIDAAFIAHFAMKRRKTTLYLLVSQFQVPYACISTPANQQPVTSNLMQSIDVYIILFVKTRARVHNRSQTKTIISLILHWNNGQHLRFKPMLKWNVFDRPFNWSSIWFTYQSNHKKNKK